MRTIILELSVVKVEYFVSHFWKEPGQRHSLIRVSYSKGYFLESIVPEHRTQKRMPPVQVLRILN